MHPTLDREAEHDRGRNRAEHLQQAEAEYELAHRAQLRERKLEADREHQEHDTELGQILRALRVRHDAERVRPDENPHRQISEHRRQIQIPEHDDAHH